MKPIINPWIFYFSEVSTTLKGAMLLTVLVGGVSFLIFLACNWECISCSSKECTDNKSKVTKTMLIILIISATLAIIIPKETTIYKMVAAKYATKNNIETIYDKIIESAAKLGEAWNNEKDTK